MTSWTSSHLSGCPRRAPISSPNWLMVALKTTSVNFFASANGGTVGDGGASGSCVFSGSEASVASVSGVGVESVTSAVVVGALGGASAGVSVTSSVVVTGSCSGVSVVASAVASSKSKIAAGTTNSWIPRFFSPTVIIQLAT